jgi:hypothetical protein
LKKQTNNDEKKTQTKKRDVGKMDRYIGLEKRKSQSIPLEVVERR